jgi:HicA toxin of bacterial toxin-antitoxin,
MKLSSKHNKTLLSIFENPIRADVAWSDVEKLFVALGAKVSEGSGSRIRVYLKGVRAVFHRPHPRKETDKGALKSVRRFLSEAGVSAKEE